MVKKILFVFGTRPEAIKMAPIIKLARKAGRRLDPVVCVTAQHRYLLDQVLDEFKIKPDIDLNIMKPGQTLYGVVSDVLNSMRCIYKKVKPDIVLVQGDTSTVLAASLSAFYEDIDIGHIEAGLRSGDNRNPFPEEINRRFVSLVAKYNFCPTETAREKLLSESVNPESIFVTGNTVIDALKEILEKVKRRPPVIKGVGKEFLKKPFVLITGHRRENFSGGMENVARTIKLLAAKHAKINWIWVVHLNPNARVVVFKLLSGLTNVKLVEPLPYSEFVYLMNKSKFIISDSGGVQEEAPSLGKTVFVTRICTERSEAIKNGMSILVGTNSAKINKEVDRILQSKKTGNKKNPFGDGKAAARVIDVILEGGCRQFRQGGCEPVS